MEGNPVLEIRYPTNASRISPFGPCVYLAGDCQDRDWRSDLCKLLLPSGNLTVYNPRSIVWNPSIWADEAWPGWCAAHQDWADAVVFDLSEHHALSLDALDLGYWLGWRSGAGRPKPVFLHADLVNNHLYDFEFGRAALRHPGVKTSRSLEELARQINTWAAEWRPDPL